MAPSGMKMSLLLPSAVQYLWFCVGDAHGGLSAQVLLVYTSQAWEYSLDIVEKCKVLSLMFVFFCYSLLEHEVKLFLWISAQLLKAVTFMSSSRHT